MWDLVEYVAKLLGSLISKKSVGQDEKNGSDPIAPTLRVWGKKRTAGDCLNGCEKLNPDGMDALVRGRRCQRQDEKNV